MSNKTLSIAIGSYDRTRPLIAGDVEVEGYDLVFETLGYPQINAKTFGDGSLDVGEVSLSSLLQHIDAGSPRYLGIPAFVSMGFRQDALYTAASSSLSELGDLAGKRIGVQGFFGATAMWLRGVFADVAGVDPRSIRWFVGGVEKGVAPAAQDHPGYDVTYLGAEQNLVDMLIADEIDVVITHVMPAAFREGRLKRLHTDVAAAQAREYEATGVIPLLHLPVVRKELLQDDPALAARLLDAFTKAKAKAIVDLERTIVFDISLPTLGGAVEAARKLIGQDFWPYGTDANRRGLETFARYAAEQGLTRRSVGIAEAMAI